jgi:hypothetical protein
MPVPPLEGLFRVLGEVEAWREKAHRQLLRELYGDTQLAVFSLMHRKDLLYAVCPTYSQVGSTSNYQHDAYLCLPILREVAGSEEQKPKSCADLLSVKPFFPAASTRFSPTPSFFCILRFLESDGGPHGNAALGG